MNTKTKESMNLKELKQSKYLVGIYLEQNSIDSNLASCLYSIANQTLPVDLLIFTNNYTDEQTARLKELIDKPYISYIERDEQGQAVERVLESEKALNHLIINLEESINFPKFFNALINKANEAGYEAVSIAEYEDGYSVRWFEVADKYMTENPEVSIFVPLIKNIVSGAFSGIMNEACWMEGMSEEAGKFDLGLLQKYNCVNPLGAVYRISSVLEYSESISGAYKPIKESIKLSHYYEFFLRMIYDDVKIMTVPRIGYEVKISNKDSFSDSSCKIPQNISSMSQEKGGINQQEASFWFELAKKEFFYDEDRNKVYEPA